MILKGSQRKWAKRLAQHLLNDRENDHVELHEIRDLAAEDLTGALMEIEASAKGTRCKEPLYSCSFSPPEGASVSLDQFEAAFDAVEKKLGLDGQPRAVVIHEKQGRRHAHVVWSRVDTERGRAIHLSFDREKLQAVSRELYRDLGLEAPAGFRDKARRDPLNYDRPVWLQAKRLGEDPRDLKAIIREAFLRSNSRASFERALEPHALVLARGDTRPYVIVHHTGEVLSLPKYSGLKTKDVRERIGEPDGLPSVAAVRGRLRDLGAGILKRRLEEARARQAEKTLAMRGKLQAIRERHRQERAVLYARQFERWKAAERVRADRLRRGIRGLVDRLTGARNKIAETNVKERAEQKVLDRQEKQALIDRQLGERQGLQREQRALVDRQKGERRALRGDIATQLAPARRELRQEFGREAGRTYEDSGQERNGLSGEFRQRARDGRDGRGEGRSRGRERGGRGDDDGRDGPE